MQSQGFWSISQFGFFCGSWWCCVSMQEEENRLGVSLMNTVRSFSLGFTVHGCWRRNAQNSTSILQWGSCIWLPAPKLGSTAVCVRACLQSVQHSVRFSQSRAWAAGDHQMIFVFCTYLYCMKIQFWRVFLKRLLANGSLWTRPSSLI